MRAAWIGRPSQYCGGGKRPHPTLAHARATFSYEVGEGMRPNDCAGYAIVSFAPQIANNDCKALLGRS